MKPVIVAALMGAVLLVSACSSEKIEVLKSPCVGLEGSPCGPKRPMNGNYNTQS
ncbi:MAG: hypothetical protein V4735_07740 [Pseudomonadota bacterium]